MKVCELLPRYLTKRGEEVCKLLSPLLELERPTPPRAPHRLAYARPSVAGGVIIAVYDGAAPLSGDYRDWRFRTFVPELTGAYFEYWVAGRTNADPFYLDRAYLHLYYPLDGDVVEFVALHCDPNEPAAAEPPLGRDMWHGPYKRDLHIHVKAAAQPIPHAHLALNQSSLAQVLSSIEALTAAQGIAVNMLREQVLKLFLGVGSEGAA